MIANKPMLKCECSFIKRRLSNRTSKNVATTECVNGALGFSHSQIMFGQHCLLTFSKTVKGVMYTILKKTEPQYNLKQMCQQLGNSGRTCSKSKVD